MVTSLNITLNETRKGLIILWDYKFSLLIQLLGIGMVFIGIMFFVGQGELEQAALASSFLGFIITFYAMETLSNMSYALTAEAQAGTLEQIYMSPAPSSLVVLGRSLSSLISATIQLVLIATLLLLLFQINVPFRWEIFPILFITMLGLLGFGYVIGGMTLIFKQVGPFANILQNMLLFINGTFLPVEYMPIWLKTFAQLLPSTQGILVMRRVAIDGASLADVWADGTLIYLVAHSGIFLLLGLFIFGYCEKIARRQGTLGQY
jgi:ABC-2 type transport system permease protein